MKLNEQTIISAEGVPIACDVNLHRAYEAANNLFTDVNFRYRINDLISSNPESNCADFAHRIMENGHVMAIAPLPRGFCFYFANKVLFVSADSLAITSVLTKCWQQMIINLVEGDSIVRDHGKHSDIVMAQPFDLPSSTPDKIVRFANVRKPIDRSSRWRTYLEAEDLLVHVGNSVLRDLPVNDILLNSHCSVLQGMRLVFDKNYSPPYLEDSGCLSFAVSENAVKEMQMCDYWSGRVSVKDLYARFGLGSEEVRNCLKILNNALSRFGIDIDSPYYSANSLEAASISFLRTLHSNIRRNVGGDLGCIADYNAANLLYSPTEDNIVVVDLLIGQAVPAWY